MVIINLFSLRGCEDRQEQVPQQDPKVPDTGVKKQVIIVDT